MGGSVTQSPAARSARAIRLFRKTILDHYENNPRPMPWRETRDPYRILVSEIMLQQTQVSRVIDKYKLFVSAFPDFDALAAAPLSRVYKVWQGLGYNRRALALTKIAKIVADRYGGQLPRAPEDLAGLPGVGPATASSIAAFAFNAPVAFVETNIRTVFIHFFFKNRTNVTDAEIMPLVTKSLYAAQPRIWYWALMDYGVMLKKSGKDKNSRSAHYVKQSRFEGSRRQVRGMVLKLLAGGTLTEKQLSNRIGDTRLKPVLLELFREGFVERTGPRVSLAGASR